MVVIDRNWFSGAFLSFLEVLEVCIPMVNFLMNFGIKFLLKTVIETMLSVVAGLELARVPRVPGTRGIFGQ